MGYCFLKKSIYFIWKIILTSTIDYSNILIYKKVHLKLVHELRRMDRRKQNWFGASHLEMLTFVMDEQSIHIPPVRTLRMWPFPPILNFMILKSIAVPRELFYQDDLALRAGCRPLPQWSILQKKTFGLIRAHLRSPLSISFI